MINVRGNLAVRVVTGRNGAFRVAKLVCDVGEFAVKSKLIEELEEGAYAGSFQVKKIFPSSYVTGGRITLEVRADLFDMQLDEVLETPPANDPLEQDPLEEEQPGTSTPQAEPPPAAVAAEAPKAETTVHPLTPVIVTESDAMVVLFGTLWPLADCVKLDPTVGRDMLRKQIAALKELGFSYAPTQQVWNRAQ